MFCNKCGGELPLDKVLCPHCGAQIPPAAIQFSAPPPPERTWTPPVVWDDKHAELRRQHPELQGVGGWLAAYAWLTLIFAPLSILLFIVRYRSLFFVSLRSPQTFVTLMASVFGIIVGILIVKTSRWALICARIRLGIQLLLSLGNLAASVRTKTIPYFLGSIVGSLLWLTYFFVSRRVKLTLDPPPPKA